MKRRRTHEQAYRMVIAVSEHDRRAPHDWPGYTWSGRGYRRQDSAYALLRSGLPLTYQSAQRMLTAALRGETIAGMLCSID